MDGSWAGTTTGEIVPLCQLVLLFAFLGREQESLAAQATRAISRQQLANGGWAATPGGVFDLDVSVLAYFALKVAGEDACGPELAAARRAIRARGGADRCREATRRWLALLGQIDYELCSPVMPEWLLATSLNPDATSRELLELAARSVAWSMRPRREIELSRGVRELFVEPPRSWSAAERSTLHVAAKFNRLWSRCERAGLLPFRRKALERASFLLTEAAVESPLAEQTFEELAWQWVALKALGLRDSSRAIQAYGRRLDSLIAVDETADEARSQPTTALSEDTSLALTALAASGLSREQPTVVAGVCWIMKHRLPVASANGRVTEMLQLLQALTTVESATEAQGDCFPPELGVLDELDALALEAETVQVAPADMVQSFIDRLVSGLSTMQWPDGGWCGGQALARQRAHGIQHAVDHREGASTAELTGRVLESISAGHACVRAISVRAIAYLKSTQQGDGCWNSTTSARYVHGTSCAVRGLLAAGVSATDPMVAQGINWLLVHQDESGGWGEAGVDAKQEFVEAEATAIQTAWAVLALVAAGLADQEATRRGIRFLVESQREMGGWHDAALVERDAEGPWYQNQLHSTTWSLLALAAWARAISETGDAPAAALRLVCGDSAS